MYVSTVVGLDPDTLEKAFWQKSCIARVGVVYVCIYCGHMYTFMYAFYVCDYCGHAS
jgi:hypothetical protein